MTEMRHRRGKTGIGEGKCHYYGGWQEEWRWWEEPEACQKADPRKQSVAEAGQRGEQKDGACRCHRESTLSIIRSSALVPLEAARSRGLAAMVALRGGR